MANKLEKLAEKYGTDKLQHGYIPYYDLHFKDLKNVCLLELGVGGYDDAYSGGESLRMWSAYFDTLNIHGIDIHKKDLGLNTYKIAQDDKEKLTELMIKINPDIIIDDCSHINRHTIASFNILFPLLKKGGYYCIEDLKEHYSDVTNFLSEGNNIYDFIIEQIKISFNRSEYAEIHLYKGLIIIKK